MIVFSQHIPYFVDHREQEKSLIFEDESEMLNSEIFLKYSSSKDFSHFAQDRNCILQISDDGFYWWVVGYFKSDTSLTIPKWTGWKFRAKKDGKYFVTTCVVMSSGGEITLTNGTKAEKVSKQEWEENALKTF